MTSACGSPRGPRCQPSPTTIAVADARGRRPSGWERRVPSPARASSSARRMCASSIGAIVPPPPEAGRHGRRTGSRTRARTARPSRVPVPSHPDSHGRFRNLTGSTHGWLPWGRGLSPPVGSYTPPRKRASVRRVYARRAEGGKPARASTRSGRALVDREGGAGVALGELLHLRRDGHRLAVVGERRGVRSTRCRWRCPRAGCPAARPCGPRRARSPRSMSSGS